MVNVARALEARGVDIPIMIGGATTSELHTALKIAPVYRGPVLWMKDASQNVIAGAKLMSPESRKELVERLNENYEVLRSKRKDEQAGVLSIDEARKRKPNFFE